MLSGVHPGDVHPQPQAHRAQRFLDLVQALAPEVRSPQHLRLGLLHQVADVDDVVEAAELVEHVLDADQAEMFGITGALRSQRG
jgi:hypothetical protein